MGDCIVRLNQLIDQLSPAEARVARYLLDHCQEAIGQPIEKVSEACQTSKTTVVRLCKQMCIRDRVLTLPPACLRSREASSSPTPVAWRRMRSARSESLLLEIHRSTIRF